MGGIVFWKKHSYSLDRVTSAFRKLDYSNGVSLSSDKWNFIFFPKLIGQINNTLVNQEGWVGCAGTFSYRGFFYESSLALIFEDFKNNKLELTSFWGTFLVVVHYRGKTALIRDGAGTYSIFGDDNHSIISSSFASIVEILSAPLTLDRPAIIELLNTGIQTSNNTIIQEIKKIPIDIGIDDILISKSSNIIPEKPKSREQAIEQQTTTLKSFYSRITKDWLKYHPEGVLDIGITGGLDSRTNAALALHNTRRVILHTHWRKELLCNKDFYYANLFARSTGLILNTKPVTRSIDMTAEQLEINYHIAYNFTDGVVRPGIYWDEEYSTADYRGGLSKESYFRLLGFGGEQYRNMEHMSSKTKVTLKSWIKWDMIYRFAGSQLSDSKALKHLITYIHDHLSEQLGLQGMDLFGQKLYDKLILVPSYRYIQAMIENRIGFCISPFQDTCLSQISLNAVPYLGSSMSFQLGLLRKISPDLAVIPNAYGFNFNDKEPYLQQFIADLWSHVTNCVKYPILSFVNHGNRSDYVKNLVSSNRFAQVLFGMVLELGLPMDFYSYQYLRSRSKLMLNLGYFLYRNKGKIS